MKAAIHAHEHRQAVGHLARRTRGQRPEKRRRAMKSKPNDAKYRGPLLALVGEVRRLRHIVTRRKFASGG